MYKASVIIPVYNAEKTLRKCVESLIYGSMENIPPDMMEDVIKAVEESKNIREEEEAKENNPSPKDRLKEKLKKDKEILPEKKEKGGEKDEND